MRSSARHALLCGSVLGFLGVALGAFGAHALETTLEAAGRVGTWDTAVFYQLVHAVVLVGLAAFSELPARRWVVWLWSFGACIFSGSLYALSLSGITLLGAITPLGGVALLGGWMVLGVGAWKSAHSLHP